MTSRSRKTGSNGARRDTSRAASWGHLGYPDWNRRPLDPQDCGLAVIAGQSSDSGEAVGVPTCGLSGRMHYVWSPSGPQLLGHLRAATRCFEGAAQSSGAVAHLDKWTGTVRSETLP
jgi:hypothetical protein